LEQKNDYMLRVEDLTVNYGMVTAIEGVSLEIKAGEFVALIGANGAGKSTFLETIIGIHNAKKGRIYYNGEDITSTSTDRIVAGGMSLCPEGRGVLPEMTVTDNLLLGAYHNRSKIKESMEFVFSMFPILVERRQQMAGTLSGGQQQMLSIARALMASPKLLLLDEPSLGLAPFLIDDILRAVTKLSQQGYTILLSEQNVKKSLMYASRGYVFDSGRIVLDGSSEELKNDSAVVDAYLGGNM
jgi:branched-chain amino acid transport system ATP-binding protein